ncbi:hypothetical protein Tco_0618291 [Tanacetum coccineum]
MDNVRPRASYSPIRRSYYTKPDFRPKNLKQDVKTSGIRNMTTAGTRAVVNTGKGKMENNLKKSRYTRIYGCSSSGKDKKKTLLRTELDSEDIAAEQALKDDLERMVAQEMAAQAVGVRATGKH